MSTGLVGSVIDKYRLEEVIGAGGMAVVYRAEHLGLSRPVAVKVLAANLAAVPQVVTRFQKEAYVQAQLVHPNIVQVFDLVVQPGLLAIVMELIEGGSLDGVVREYPGGVPLGRALRLFHQVLGAIEHAHSRGVLHRDIKPANVMVAGSGDTEVAKVSDFGLARIVSEEGRITRDGTRMGTAAYMSPEQIRRPLDVDARTDVYSLGVMLFEMLSGQLPFSGSTDYEVMSQVLGMTRPPSLRARNPAVPEAIEAAVRRAMAPDPNARWSTVAEFARALREPAAPGRGAPVPASGGVGWTPARGQVARTESRDGKARSPLAILAASGAAVLVVGGAIGLAFTRGDEARVGGLDAAGGVEASRADLVAVVPPPPEPPRAVVVPEEPPAPRPPATVARPAPEPARPAPARESCVDVGGRCVKRTSCRGHTLNGACPAPFVCCERASARPREFEPTRPAPAPRPAPVPRPAAAPEDTARSVEDAWRRAVTSPPRRDAGGPATTAPDADQRKVEDAWRRSVRSP